MGLDINLDITPFLKTCEDMVQQIQDFPLKMEGEMTEWQVDDMKRKFPNTSMPDEHTVQTEIWPRSRVPQEHRPTGRMRGRPRGGIKTAPVPRQTAGGRPVSQRPILRPELYDMLHDRMTQLLATIKWTAFRYKI